MTYLPPLAPTLAAALRDVESHDPARRLDAAERLWAAEEEDQRVLPALRTLASDPVGPVRQAALHALVEAQDADATPLFRAACEDPDHFVCHVALRGLVAVQAPEARTLVDDWLTSEFTDRRRTALWCLKDGWVESCRDLVLQALDDDESSVRATAAGILTELADPCTADALNSRLLDIVPLVRRTAATALARLGDQRATPALLEALDDRAHRLDIIEALGELGDPAAIPALLKLAGRRFGSMMDRAAAGAALYRLGSPEGVAHLRAVLRGWRAHARPFAVQLVGELGIQELGDELRLLASRRNSGAGNVMWAIQALDADSAGSSAPVESGQP